MPCLLVILALCFPRVVLACIYLLNTPYLQSVFQTILWPVLGFLFMPYTTLAYAWGMHQGVGMSGLPLVVLIVAVLVDLGVVGGGAKARRR